MHTVKRKTNERLMPEKIFRIWVVFRLAERPSFSKSDSMVFKFYKSHHFITKIMQGSVYGIVLTGQNYNLTHSEEISVRLSSRTEKISWKSGTLSRESDRLYRIISLVED
jgi:hypothetical protein